MSQAVASPHPPASARPRTAATTGTRTRLMSAYNSISDSASSRLSAAEAERIGLVNHVFDDADFESSVERYVADFERVSRSAVRLTKRLLYHMDGLTFDAALQAGADTNTVARMTEDCRAGVARFLKKEK